MLDVLDISVVVLTMQKGPFSEVSMQYSEKLEGPLHLLKLSLSAYLVKVKVKLGYIIVRSKA